MRPVKTHTFNGRKYTIDQVDRIDGVTEIPGEPDTFDMLILTGNDLKALHSALHEGGEAIGQCDKCMHGYKDDNQMPNTYDVARFLWRLGWRKNLE